MAASLACAGVAWRLLASLEGAALLLAASALLARAAAAAARAKRPRLGERVTRRDHAVQTVLLTNATSALGTEIKRSLELRGCTVREASGAAGAAGPADALVVVGGAAGAGAAGDLHALAGLVSEDVHRNLKLLSVGARRVRSGGRVCWASAAPAGLAVTPLAAAAAAFHAVLRAALDHTAANAHCAAVWVQCSGGPRATAERVAAALLAHDMPDTCIALRS